jgi:cellulose synthase/poly-beta-1,6-N-acetylglucosamine synthase-like glycosyltransferase/peptidoglycan/xylan/chitin deacetylase (PgdA/CDA1 family)/spore germination protein YaaH
MKQRGAGSPFVFLDPHGKRWPRLRRVLVLAGVLVFVALVLFVQALFVRPELRLPAKVRQLKGQLRALTQQAIVAPNPKESKFPPPPSLAEQERIAKLREQLRAKPRKFSEIRAGFYESWDANSYESLEQHANLLTHICPEWMSIADASGTLRMDEDGRVARLAATRGLVLIPLLNNLINDVWQPEAVENLANGPDEPRNQFVVNLLSQLESARAGGVLIDWEQIDPAYKDQVTKLLTKISDALHAVDKELWLEVPMGDEFESFDLETLSDHVDHFVAVLYDETSDTDQPGPIASQDWFDGWLKVITGYGEPEQWIAAIGTYGYDWTTGQKRAETISFCDAMSRASYAGVDEIKMQGPSYNALFSYSEPQGDHTVCFLDAVTFLNQLRSARAANLGGIALGRLGTEDPQIWDVLSLKRVDDISQNKIDALKKMRGSNTITNVGAGEMIAVDDTRDDGEREINLEPSGRFTTTYKNDPDPQKGFPTYPVLYHQGAGGEHEVALTFDDGPDPKWTPQVLDILKQKGVKAAFFLVGRNAETYPKLVERIVAEGHEIGNHTYYHSNIAAIPREQTRLELNATQRLIESITGRSTTLFRPPYNADSRPSTLDQLTPLKYIQDDLGYLMVMENIDPEDWARPGAEVILNRVKEFRRDGSLILLHDAGGDRQQTIEALPKIIDWLHERGDRIVSLGELLHIPRDDLMPPVNATADPVTRIVTGAGFRIWHAIEEFGWAFMIAATAMIVLRTIIVAVLAAKHHRRRGLPNEADFAPPLSVIIAAYNEGKVIQATLRSVVDTDYPGEMEIVVIDDGSKDNTAEEVRQVAKTDPRIRLLQQPNGGKAEALRRGVGEAEHGVFVFLDADTHFNRATLRELVKPLHDEKVGAVSGHAKVGNLRSFIARCQSLEYTCGFNLDRRAYTEWNCITVAPGAISAVRKSALQAAGGFSLDTLAEDTDLTLSLHRFGYRIEYVPGALAWTEAPETVRTLAKQRFRWAFGTMQCLWKHRDMIFNPRFKALGWFSLPNIWFFQILLVAITPVVDTLLVISLVFGGASAMWSYFIVFLLMDLLLAILACWLENEKLRNAWLIIPMRLIYRPLLSWVIWRALYQAIRGAWVTWGKLERTASVPART